MKKILSLIVVVLSLCQHSFAYSFSAVAPSGQTLYYNIVNGNAEVTSQNGSSPYYNTYLTGNLVIPSSVTYAGSTYNVTRIGTRAIYNCSGLTSVTIPNSVTSIGERAFWGCSGLTSVNYTGTIAQWCGIDFGNPTANPTYYSLSLSINGSLLTNLVIPDGVTEIKQYAFFLCSSLTSVTIPNSVTSIGSHAFRECSGLTTVTIPNSVTSIGSNAFYYCSGLTSVIIPNSVISIGEDAFRGCSGLTSVNYTGTIAQWCGIDFSCDYSNPTYYSLSLSINGSLLTNLVIPDGVTEIKQYSFYNCSGLTSVTIPNSVTSIGYYAFYNCSGLTTVTIPNSVTSIGYSAFYGCSSLTSLTIPNSVTSIGEMAFSNCSGLTTVNFNATNCTTMVPFYNSVFGSCTNLATLHIGENVTQIPAYAFSGCNGLTEITSFAPTAPILGNCAFSGVSNTIPVYTPCGSLASYQTTWSYFSNIIAPFPNISLNVGVANSTSGVTTIIEGPTCDSTAVIEAAANYGYHFTQWNDGNTDNPRTLSLTQDTSFIAYFASNQYNITGTSADEARGSVTGGNTVDYLDTVILTATANYGYHFTRWQDYNTNNPRSIQVTQNKTYTAYFYFNQYSITLGVDTNIHGAVSGGGNYNYLSNRTITATPNYGYHFTQWNDGNTDNPRTLSLTQDTAFTAYFAPNQYTIIGTSADETRGSVTGGNTVDYLDSITLTASANYGYHFEHWNDMNDDNPRPLQVTQDQTYTAYFDFNHYSITLNVDTSIHGTCSGGGSHNYLSNCTITATTNYGYHFTQWSDGDTNNPRTITLTQDTAFTAFFERNEYTLTFQSADTTKGIVTVVSVPGIYLDTTPYITAAALPHYHFTQWNDGSTLNPRRFVIERDQSYTASFAIDTHTVSVQLDNIAHGTVQGGGRFIYGTATTVSATNFSGYHFAHWSDGSTYNPYTFAVLEDKNLTAIFIADGEPWQDTVVLYDTTYVILHDTAYINVPVHDTTYIDVPVHDTTIVTDTVTMTEYVPVHDTTYIDVPYPVHDTTVITDTVTMTEYVPVHDTTYIDIHDTTYINVSVHDTTFVTDTMIVTQFDTMTVTDTMWLTQTDTLWLHDTIIIHDTVYITQEGIDGADALNAKVYSSRGQIVVEGADGNPVTLFDLNGRMLATKQDYNTAIRFDAPASGTYMIKIGNHTARKVVVVR